MLYKQKLEVIKKHKVTRISINPQTMQQKTLDIIGRRHTVEDIRTVYDMARELGFDNINMDLIAGLPGETVADMQDTLEKIAKLKPDSLTVHALAMKRASKLSQEKKEIQRTNEEEVKLAEELEQMEMSTFSVSRGMVNTMSDIRGTEIWVNFTEADGGVLCELRSSGPNINPIAVKYGGGGHAKASGAKVADRETAMKMLADLDAMCSR